MTQLGGRRAITGPASQCSSISCSVTAQSLSPFIIARNSVITRDSAANPRMQVPEQLAASAEGAHIVGGEFLITAQEITPSICPRLLINAVSLMSRTRCALTPAAARNSAGGDRRPRRRRRCGPRTGTRNRSALRAHTAPGGEPPAPACARRFSPGKIHRKGTLAFQGGDQILAHQPGENVVADKERYVFILQPSLR